MKKIQEAEKENSEVLCSTHNEINIHAKEVPLNNNNRDDTQSEPPPYGAGDRDDVDYAVQVKNNAQKKRLEEIERRERELREAREQAQREKKALKMKFQQQAQQQMQSIITDQHKKINENVEVDDDNSNFGSAIDDEVEEEMDPAEVLRQALIENMQEKKKLQQHKAEVIDVDLGGFKKGNGNNRPIIDIHGNTPVKSPPHQAPLIDIQKPIPFIDIHSASSTNTVIKKSPPDSPSKPQPPPLDIHNPFPESNSPISSPSNVNRPPVIMAKTPARKVESKVKARLNEIALNNSQKFTSPIKSPDNNKKPFIDIHGPSTPSPPSNNKPPSPSVYIYIYIL